MNIRVYNDNALVFSGTLEKFLEDNQYDPDVVEECKQLQYKDVITMNFFHSGEWRIEKS